MPNFTSVFSADSWRRKFEEARISDLNYELGKWAQESKNKLSHRLRLGNSPSSGSSWHSNRSAVPKSTSVPAGLTLFPKSKSSNSFIGITKTSNNYQQDHRISDRYQYRSSALPTCEEELLSSGELQLIEEEIIKSAIPDSNVVEKFIKVIEGNPTNPAAGPAGLKKTAFKSREEIRKKLAFGGTDSSGAGSNFSTGTGESENTNSNLKKKPPQQSNNDLEVCFINEYSTADSTSSSSSVLDNSNNSTHALSRSKSEYVSISSCFNQLELDPSLVNVTSSSSSQTSSLLEYTQKLANCKDIARRKIFIEKRNRKFHHINTLNKLIGKSIEIKLSSDILSQMNTPTIQVIVNDFHSKIENLNEELVNELMQKDELQIEQDGVLMDIDDYLGNNSY